MNHRGSWVVIAALALALSGCSAASGGETVANSEPTTGAVTAETSPPVGTSPADPAAGDDDPADPTDAGDPADPAQGDDYPDEEPVPNPPAYDVDAAAPLIVTGTVKRDVAIRYGDHDMIKVSPRSFTVSTAADGTTTITAKWHVLGIWGHHDMVPHLDIVPATWTPATECGTEPPSSVIKASANMAIAGLYYSDDFAVTSTFTVSDAGPWYLIARDGETTTCNLAAWSIPVAGASR